MKKYFISLIISLFLSGLSANGQQTRILSPDKHNEYGLIYTLPNTAFEVELTIEKVKKTAGPFYQYAKRFIGVDNVINEDEITASIKNISVRPYGIPDTENRYLMQLKPGATTFIVVDENGMLLSINAQPENKVIEKRPIIETQDDIPAIDEYLQYVPEDFSTAISSLKKAELIAESLTEVREAKLALTRGTAETMPTDGKQLEIMLNSLSRQEKSLTSAFTGIVSTFTETRTLSFIPEKDGKSVLCRINDIDGIIGADDYSGEPVYVTVKITSEGELPIDSKGEEKKIPKDAVIYCVPGTAEISISSKSKTLFSEEFEIAQFGFLFGLNPALFTDKKTPSFAIFDPATGALKELGTVKE